MSKFYTISIAVWFSYFLGMANAFCITNGIFAGIPLLTITGGLIGVVLYIISKIVEKNV